MRRLRLLHTESSCGWGGQELRILEEAKGMAARGHEVWIAAPPEARLCTEARASGLPTVALPIARKGARGLVALRRFVRICTPDVINTHSSTDTWLAALGCLALAHPPRIVRTRHISAPIPRNRATQWLYRRATAMVVTTGEALRDQVVRETGIPPARVRSVPTGVALDRFRPAEARAARAAVGLPAEGFTAGIVATLRSWKGHRFLIDAMKELPGVRLVIVGDGPGRDNVKSQVLESGLADRVVLAGHQADVVPWLQSLDVFVLPSYANEGVPQAIMQAMACGIPVITTDVGAIGEIVEDGRTGLLVPVRDPVAIARAIRRLAEDESLRRRLADAGLAQARERFSMERMLEGMEAVFNAVLESPAL